MYNKIILVGNLTRDVDLKNLPSGSMVAKFGLATSRKWRDKNSGENREEVMFVDITTFGRSAEIAKQYIRKGSKVLIEGRLVLQQWTDTNGQKRSKHEVQADTIQFMDTKAESQTFTPPVQQQQPQQQTFVPTQQQTVAAPISATEMDDIPF